MTDFLTSPQRHANMVVIHGKDTKLEMVVCRWLWGAWIPLSTEPSAIAGEA